jgi:hypothetical protein
LTYAGRVNWVEAEKLFSALAEYQISIFRDVWSNQIEVLMDRDKLLRQEIVEIGFKYKSEMVQAAYEGHEEVY